MLLNKLYLSVQNLVNIQYVLYTERSLQYLQFNICTVQINIHHSKCLSHGGTWSNRLYVALALFSLLCSDLTDVVTLGTQQ